VAHCGRFYLVIFPLPACTRPSTRKIPFSGDAVSTLRFNQNQNQFYFRVDVETLKQVWATIGDREVAKPTIISALNLFRACTLNGIPLCNT